MWVIQELQPLGPLSALSLSPPSHPLLHVRLYYNKKPAIIFYLGRKNRAESKSQLTDVNVTSNYVNGRGLRLGLNLEPQWGGSIPFALPGCPGLGLYCVSSTWPWLA